MVLETWGWGPSGVATAHPALHGLWSRANRTGTGKPEGLSPAHILGSILMPGLALSLL